MGGGEREKEKKRPGERNRQSKAGNSKGKKDGHVNTLTELTRSNEEEWVVRPALGK